MGAQAIAAPFKGWERVVGKVVVDIRIENRLDLELVRLGRMDAPGVRTVLLHDVLVDTGASHLCLPASLIAELGLPLREGVEVATATGVLTTRRFDMAELTIGDRTETVSVIELPGSAEPLLGYIPMEQLGVTPDVVNHRLLFQPKTGPGTYFLV